MKNLNKKLLPTTHYLLLTILKVSFIAFILFFILNVVTQGFVNYYLDFKFWLWGLIILSLVLYLFKKHLRFFSS